MQLVIDRGRGRPQWFWRRALFAVVALGLVIWLLAEGFNRWTRVPAPLAGNSHKHRFVAVEAAVAAESGQVVLRSHGSSLRLADGLWRLRLRGSARQRGSAYAQLASRLYMGSHATVAEQNRPYLPSGWAARLWQRARLRWVYRNLSGRIAPEYRDELAALASSLPRSLGDPRSVFEALVYRHLLDDLWRRTGRGPWPRSQTFALWGRKTTEGHLLVGRSFAQPTAVTEPPLLLAFHSTGRIPVVSIAWPGMLGVVTGVNAHGVFASLHTARVDGHAPVGQSEVFLVRALLETSPTLEAAIAQLKKAKPSSTFSLLVAGRSPPRSVVAEVSPRRIAIRREAHRAVATNHFVHSKYQADAANDRVRRYSSSGARRRRLSGLLAGFSGRFDAQRAAALLRDRWIGDRQEAAFGHRSALATDVGVHAVVIDLTEMLMWVCQGPYGLQPYVPVDLSVMLGLVDTSREIAGLQIPADPVLSDPKYIRFGVARRQFNHALQLRRAGQISAALDFAKRAVALAPWVPRAQVLLADVLWDVGERKAAAKRYRAFLALAPAYRADIERVEQRLATLN